MKKWKSPVLVGISLLMMLSLVACGTGKDADENIEETVRESETIETAEGLNDNSSTTEETDESESEAEELQTELVRDVVSFVDYTATRRDCLALGSEESVAVSFTVPDGYLKEFYLNLTNNVGYTECDLQIALYRFVGDYGDSVAVEPLYREEIEASLKTYTLSFEDGQIPAGDYLVVLSGGKSADGGEGAYSSVMYDGLWKPSTLPEEYKRYAIVSYTNGKVNRKTVMCCGMTIERYDTVKKTEPRPVVEVEADGVAKVILLAGQSNAAGVSQTAILQKKIAPEDFARYSNGFQNVKILYKNGNQEKMMNCNDSFVHVKLGQGIEPLSFGPEIGLAEYLSEAYPDETFYIIKYGVGGTNLYSHWSIDDPSRSKHYTGFRDTIDEGLGLLEKEGLTPRIVGFLWMQGESDATQFYHAHQYYNREKALVESIRAGYADYAPEQGIPFIDAAVSNSGFFASWFLVNAMKESYAAQSVDNYFIDTVANGLTTFEENNDLAHYDSISMLLLGRSFGDRLAYALNGDRDDGICPHVASDYRIEADTHDTVCRLCGKKLASEAHMLAGGLIYDAVEKAYKGSCVCGAAQYQYLSHVMEARTATGACENMTVSIGSEDGEDYVRYTQNADKRVRFYLIFGNKSVTGQYMVVKYRLINNGKNTVLADSFAATTASANPMARGNGDFCGDLGELVGDGEWHYLVVDLAERNAENSADMETLQFMKNADGEYACAYIRADFLLDAFDGSCYLDVASVGFTDQRDAIQAFIEKQTSAE